MRLDGSDVDVDTTGWHTASIRRGVRADMPRNNWNDVLVNHRTSPEFDAWLALCLGRVVSRREPLEEFLRTYRYVLAFERLEDWTLYNLTWCEPEEVQIAYAQLAREIKDLSVQYTGITPKMLGEQE